MRSIRRLAYAVLFVGTVAAAQPDASAPPAAVPTAPAPKVKKALSPEEMRTGADGIGAQIQADYQHVLRLQGVARKMKDVIKLNCVNDKLVQLKAQMNIADSGTQSLRGALDRGEDGKTLFDAVSGSGNTVKELREAANGCIGESDLIKQEFGISVTKPEITDDPGVIDPYLGDYGDIVVEPPGYASPYN